MRKGLGMVHIKFLLFAIIVLGLWIGHLYRLSPSLSARAVDSAAAQVRSAPLAVRVNADQRRHELQRTVARGARSAMAWLQAARSRGESATLDKVSGVRDAVQNAAPEAMRSGWIVGLVLEQGAAYARGGGPVTGEKAAVDLNALTAAGYEGSWQDVLGASYWFFSFPIDNPEKLDAKPLGFLVLGAPIALDALLEPAVKESMASGIALVRAGKVVAVTGEKEGLDGVEKRIRPGTTGVVGWGSLGRFGPLKLPFLTSFQTDAGAPLWVGTRQAVPSTPYEVIGVVSLYPFMQALADYQQMALLGFLVILILSVAWMLLSGLRPELLDEQREEAYAGSPGFRGFAMGGNRRAAAPSPPALTSAGAETAREGEWNAPSPPPEPWPEEERDEEDRGSQLESNLFGAAPAHEGDRSMAESIAPSPPPGTSGNDDAGAAAMRSTHEYPPDYNPEYNPDYSPEATRVADIPEELLRASAAVSEDEPVPHRAFPAPSSAPTRPTGASEDEAHFQDVFREFLAARERCGEPLDGLTYERFAKKLRKNRDQLIEKYNCRTVRFQVYVKEGKAALRATPIKH